MFASARSAVPQLSGIWGTGGNASWWRGKDNIEIGMIALPLGMKGGVGDPSAGLLTPQNVWNSNHDPLLVCNHKTGSPSLFLDILGQWGSLQQSPQSSMHPPKAGHANERPLSSPAAAQLWHHHQLILSLKGAEIRLPWLVGSELKTHLFGNHCTRLSFEMVLTILNGFLIKHSSYDVLCINTFFLSWLSSVTPFLL